MWKFVLSDWKSHKSLDVASVLDYAALRADTPPLLVTMSPLLAHGVFKTVQITSGTTTTVASPDPGGSLLITDIVVSAKKVTGTTIDIEFDDGVNTEIFMSPDTVNVAANIAWPIMGRVQGWRDAALKVFTVGANTVASVTVCYVKMPTALDFSEWSNLR